MIFKRKSKEDVQETLELLYPENVKVGCKADTKENVIKMVGQMLVDTGYVEQPYVDAMLKREETFSTYMGNELALPHGVEEAKKDIKASGIAILVFPEGTKWENETVKIVVGIAGVGEEHLQILSVIADKMLEPGSVDKIVNSSAQDVYKMFKKGN